MRKRGIFFCSQIQQLSSDRISKGEVKRVVVLLPSAQVNIKLEYL